MEVGEVKEKKKRGRPTVRNMSTPFIHALTFQICHPPECSTPHKHPLHAKHEELGEALPRSDSPGLLVSEQSPASLSFIDDASPTGSWGVSECTIVPQAATAALRDNVGMQEQCHLR